MFSGHFLENGVDYAGGGCALTPFCPCLTSGSACLPRHRRVAGRHPLRQRPIELFDELRRRRPWRAHAAGAGLPVRQCRANPGAHAAAAPELKPAGLSLAIGGEHSITAPPVAAGRPGASRVVGVLHLDAHLDLRGQYHGDPLSHACVMRRVMDLHVPIVHAGIRSLCEEEYKLVNRRHLPVFWWHDLALAGGDAWMDALLDRLADPVYISLDVDVLERRV